MNKHKLHRSSLKKSYYTQQFKRTERNKLAVRIRRKRRADHWAAIKASKEGV